jgi:formylglycine-generating enzyme required for sulfatase activity
MGHIFVSYSRKDEKYVKKLIETLQSEGFEVWIDTRDMGAGAEWHKAIEDNINRCGAFIVVMSQNSKDSDWVLSEVLQAKEIKRPIFPLLLEGKVWLVVKDRNPVIVTDGSLPDEKFFSQLAKFTKRRKVTSSPPPVINPRPTPRPPRQSIIDPKTVVKVIAGIAVVLLVVFGISRLTNYLSQTPIPDVTVSATSQVTVTSSPQSTPTVTLLPPTPTFTLALSTETVTTTVTPTSLPADIPDEITDEKGIRMNLVPAGTFSMGSDYKEGNYYPMYWWDLRAATPIHDVYLDSYYMDVYEVTNLAYKMCVDDGACGLPKQITSNARNFYYGNSRFDNYPVIYVNWDMANSYCKWRSMRLPTESEWEKAARGTDNRIYPWGNNNTNCTQANRESCNGDTAAVGKYENDKSPYSMYDMAGNVEEWVNDWYSETYYQYSPTTNPLGPDTGRSRVVRGGSWRGLSAIRTDARQQGDPTYYSYYIGFRCAKSP